MTIMETPRRGRGGVRSSSGGLVARFLRPLLFSHRNAAARLSPAAPRAAEEALPDKAARPADGADRRAGSNAPLASLAGGDLATRFHAWRGTSGRRYICSVFPIDAGDPEAGLPDLGEAIVMAVSRDGEGRRQRIALFISEPASDATTRRNFIAEALAGGAAEWHVHLLAKDAAQRQAAANDIESCPRSDASPAR